MRAMLFGLGILLLAPTADACSWFTPEISALTWTENGFFFRARTELRYGDERESRSIAELGPFSGYLVAPNGTLAYYARGLGGVGGDCSIPYTIVERWTPSGTTNVTDVMSGLPLAIHWPTRQGVFVDRGGAILRDLDTGATGARLVVGHDAGGVSYFGSSPRPRAAAWSPDGTKIALVTEDGVWMFDSDGTYVTDSYAQFPVQGAIVSWAPNSTTLAVAWAVQGDRFTEVRLLHLEPTRVEFQGGYADVRSLMGLAYAPDGRLALALHERPLYEGERRGNASILFFDGGLEPIGTVTFESAEFLDRSLTWSPEGHALAIVLGDRIVRVDPSAAAGEHPKEIVVKQPLLPIPAGGIILAALALAIVALRRRR